MTVPASNHNDSNDSFGIGRGSDILAVDDNEANLVAIEAALTPVRRKVVFARSGPEALSRLLEQDFALILLDVAMPGMDGFECARLIRSHERGRTIPIIFVTAMLWKHAEVLRSYELGAFDFLTKPIDTELLIAKVRIFVDLQERTLDLQRKNAALRHAETIAHEQQLVAQRRQFDAERLQEHLQQLAAAERRKDELLAILAHELRNPLQPVRTAIDLIRQHPDQPVPVPVQNILERKLTHISRLVDDLLDVSRLTAGTFQLQRESVTIADVIDEAIQANRAAIETRAHTITVSSNNAGAVVVNADRVRLVQVLNNLISNASRFTGRGGRIDVEWGLDGAEAYVRVSDSGRGISAELLPTMFDMFVAQRVTPDGSGGLGLGLALAKRIMDLHGGLIRVDSAGPGKGSTFEIRLAAMLQPQPQVTRRIVKPRPDGSLRMIVCDDEPDIRELVAEMMRGYGHEVTEVADGASAVEHILAERPDVGVIDIGLPDMSGYEVARSIRRQLGDSAPRLIAVTGYGQASDRAAALEAGFDVHLVKPASSDQLLRSLRAAPDEASVAK